jgi:hypothetical protein
MNKLNSVSSEALDAFTIVQNEIIQETVERSMEHTEEISQHGDRAHELLTSGMSFTVQMLVSAMQTGEPNLLDDQAKWASQRLPHDQVFPDQIIKRLVRMEEVVNEKMTESHANEITQYVQYLINRIKEYVD